MPDYESVILATKEGRYSLELVPEFGGLVNRLCFKDDQGLSHEMLAGLPDRSALEQDVFYRGAMLYPFVSRLEGGQYQHLGVDYQFERNEPARNNSLHGFLNTLVPEVIDRQVTDETAQIALRYDYHGQIAAYPFPAEIKVLFQLQSESGLTMTMQVHNLHDQAVPLTMGWHPYFSLGEPADQLTLQLPDVERIAIDERLLPTGGRLAFDQFAQGAVIGNFLFDDCMALANTNGERVTTMLWSERQGKGIELWQQAEAFPYLQVFIPPDRESVALEPVSGGINAFNTGENLVLLEPGQVFSASCGVKHINKTL